MYYTYIVSFRYLICYECMCELINYSDVVMKMFSYMYFCYKNIRGKNILNEPGVRAV